MMPLAKHIGISHRASRFAAYFLLVAVLIELPFLLGEFFLALDTRAFDPDSFALSGFFRYYDPQLFPHDYIADYFLSLRMPVGFRLMQRAWALMADPFLLQRWQTIVLWLACVPLVYAAARRLGVRMTAYASVAMYMGSSIFIFRITGGMAHSFGFPLVWWTVAALLNGRPVWLALATLASAAFYPFITPLAGGSLACWLLFPAYFPHIPTRSPLLQWARLKKLLFLAGVAGLAALIVLPMVAGTQAENYGRHIALPADAEQFPELQNVTSNINAFFYVMVTYVLQHASRFGLEVGQMITMGVIGVLLMGLLCRDTRDRRLGSLSPFLYVSAATFFVSLLFVSDCAYHFAIFTVPVLVTLYGPLALRSICRALLPKKMRIMAFALIMLCYLGAIGRAEPSASGYLFTLQDFQVRALDFIATLPKDTLIAGWPGDRFGRIAEAVPYVARRQSLITWGGHAVVQTNYALEMRARMNAVVDAYLARDMAPLRQLRDRFHVDYLVVNEADFQGTEPPYYIEPFSSRARALWESHADKAFIVLSLANTASVYAQDGIVIIDLHLLP